MKQIPERIALGFTAKPLREQLKGVLSQKQLQIADKDQEALIRLYARKIISEKIFHMGIEKITNFIRNSIIIESAKSVAKKSKK